MTVADRYTTGTPQIDNKTCPSCKAENQPYLISTGDDKECPKCYVKPEQPGLGELTDKYIRQGMSEDDAFGYACEDRGYEPKKNWRKY